MAQMRSRKRPESVPAEIPMTPMIDVVFLMLIYFLITLRPEDVVARLDVYRPQTDDRPREDAPPPNLVRIGVYPLGFTLNDRTLGLSHMETVLNRLASHDPNQTVVIMVHKESDHEQLVRVLDICAKTGMRNLSVMSVQ